MSSINVAICALLSYIHSTIRLTKQAFRPKFTKGLFCLQKYILGFLARVVFYNTGHTETRENKAPRAQLQLDTRGSRATEEEGRTKARITMKKWKNRKIRDFLAHRFTGIFYLQAIECNLHGNSSCCTGRRPDECFVATPPLLLLTPTPFVFTKVSFSFIISTHERSHALTRFLGPHGCILGIISVLSVVFSGWCYAKT